MSLLYPPMMFCVAVMSNGDVEAWTRLVNEKAEEHPPAVFSAQLVIGQLAVSEFTKNVVQSPMTFVGVPEL